MSAKRVWLTVWGMMLTFKAIAAAGSVPKPSEMAYGIMQALVTTFEGLLVAIPCIVFFTFLRDRVSRILVEVGVAAGDLTGRFKGMTVQGGTLPSSGKPGLPIASAGPASPAA